MRHINRMALFAMVAMSGMYRAEAEEGNSGQSAAPESNATNNAAAPVVAPTAEEIAAAEAAKQIRHTEIKAKFNNKVDIKETAFHFRKVQNEVKDEAGKVTGKIETKRPTVTLPIPVPSVEGIIDILQSDDPKELELLLEAVAGVIMEQARDYINVTDPVTEANFPFDRMAWKFIANLPKAERRGGGISKEVWEDFQKDYIEVMPAVTGKKKEAVELAAKVFVTKFAGQTTNKPVLKVLQGQLALYASNTTQGEQFAQCIEFLSEKLDKLINTDETNLLLAL